MLSWEHRIAARGDRPAATGTATRSPRPGRDRTAADRAGGFQTQRCRCRTSSASTSQLIADQRFGCRPAAGARSTRASRTRERDLRRRDRARAHGEDDVQFRRHAPRLDSAARDALPPAGAAKRGAWGRSVPSGHAYGVAVHAEYRSAVAYLVEIDATDPADPRLDARVRRGRRRAFRSTRRASRRRSRAC